MVRFFGYFISKSFLILGQIEFLVFAGSVWAALMLQQLFSKQLMLERTEMLTSSIIYAVVMMMSMVALGLYQRGVLERASGLILRLILVFAFGVVLMSLIFYIFPDVAIPPREFGLSLLISITGVLMLRSVFVRVTRADSRKRRVLVLGTGINADRIEDLFSTNSRLGYVVVGYINLGDSISLIEERRQIPKDQELYDIATRMAVDEVVVAVDDRRKGLPVNELIDCKMKGVEILDLLTFYEKEDSIIKIDLLHPSWIFFSSGFYSGGFSIQLKRLLDVFVSLVLLVLVVPLMVLVAFASLIESRWRDPVLYHQTRVGKDGKLFQIHKFRSMRVNAEAETGARWASVNDDRITRLGAFLRFTRLDELPQLYNVLRGEMSLVGPRPERPEFVRRLTQEIPYYEERHRVKPGLTGWAQLMFSYAANREDTRKKLEYDLYYVKNSSLFLDLIILLETVEVVLLAKGAR
ncbi:TIGR03013 family XrtA/PEP-CTERM system glycosyltransferase [endosymbiont of Ridgeia piscesae]|jgi:sugar transferase (PEP-CTERM system associated)|uniref:Sugar transferase n=1 Tax=endosymbiont of Ridgeia piscesae TaxID=54398 RepID=A0A0T5YYX2_9GAMM|nr:TIGR03013 family XrtA/PEP-CTERM system glycosyltransferase [endosymbiont of Ridgeia piscesae]KRT55818.1 sugar transferase [endosymbiont of Ridgeia piscesae]KRT59013.1 sugar transferase [endosymbiont of Ridgeia piscesae]